jgi:hypothetical protein
LATAPTSSSRSLANATTRSASSAAIASSPEPNGTTGGVDLASLELQPDRALVGRAADHRDPAAGNIGERAHAGGGLDQHSRALDEGDAREIDLAHARQRDRARAALHVCVALRDHVEARLHGDQYPFDLEVVDLELAGDRAGDALAKVDREPVRRAAAHRERERHRVAAHADGDGLGFGDLLQPPFEGLRVDGSREEDGGEQYEEACHALDGTCSTRRNAA